MKKSIILLFVLVSYFNAFTQTYTLLETLDLSKVLQQISAPVSNKSVVGEKILVAGKKFDRGIGVHSNSTFKINLHHSRHFSAKIGINDRQLDYSSENIKSIPMTDGTRIFYKVTKDDKQFIGIEGKDGKVDNGSVVFKVLHNGREVYNSGVMRQGDKAKEIDIPVKGGVLELIVEDAGDGISGDHAMWLYPKIEYFEIAPVAADMAFQGNQPEERNEHAVQLKEKISTFPTIEFPLQKTDYDWLIDNSKAQAAVYSANNNNEIVLSNGLIARVFRVVPNLATVDYVNQMTGESILRASSHEGVLTIDGKSYTIGGLSKQPEYGYTMKKWIEDLSIAPNAFIVNDFEVKEITDRMEWKRVRWAGNTKMPSGKELVFTLKKDGIVAKVHFALYDGIPTLCKWIEVINHTEMLVKLNTFKLEQLAMIEGENQVHIPEHWRKPNIHIETDYAFGAMQQKTSDVTSYWETDSRFTSQTNYALQLPCLLEVRPPVGVHTGIPVNESLTTFRVWETPMDTREEEREGLFKRKMYRTISPWTTENPIFLHLTSSDPKIVKEAVDQCAEVGYEMIILSFGSGLDMEKESEKYYQHFKELREYANSKEIELGGYSLLASRWISEEVDVIDPKTGKRGGAQYGSAPCLCSDWGYDYFRKLKKFYNKTGMQVFENDGSYPGDVCASTTHTHHNGLGDSQWKQYAQIQGLYKWMRSEGIYMNVPDFYLNSGSNKSGIGYREVNWSLPRERQAMHGRLNIYDALYFSIPSMVWTFVPLTQYHGGGAAATMEPLKDHLHDYELQMMQNYGSGVQACYRGPRLYDAPESKALVVEAIEWYKQYRDILNSDIIHLKRPSGKDWDGMMHVNPKLKEKGVAMFFNPTDEPMEREIDLPLYYTGLTDTAKIREKENKVVTYQLDREYNVKLKVTIPAKSYNWYVIE